MAQSNVKLDDVMTVDDLYEIYDTLHLALDEEEISVKVTQIVLDTLNIIERITDEIYRQRVEMGEITYKELWEEDIDAKF